MSRKGGTGVVVHCRGSGDSCKGCWRKWRRHCTGKCSWPHSSLPLTVVVAAAAKTTKGSSPSQPTPIFRNAVKSL